MPEAFQNALPAAIAAEQPGVERERCLKRNAALAMFEAAQGRPDPAIRRRVIG